MSGTLPTTPQIRTYQLTSFQPSIVDLSQSNRRHSRLFSDALWTISATYPTLKYDDLFALYAFALKQRGAFDTFKMTLPDKLTPKGAWSGTPVVNGASQSGNSLVLDGASASITDWAKQGDILKVAPDSKVYMVTDDANSDGGGNVTLNLHCDLQSTPADNAAITSSNVAFTVAFTDPRALYNIRPGQLYEITLGFIEHIG